MVVFLAAGATFTAEAGVVLVKGANLKADDQVIIANKEIPADGSVAKVLTVDAGALGLAEITNATSEESLKAFLWKVGGSQQSLVWVNDGTRGVNYTSQNWSYGDASTLSSALGTATDTKGTTVLGAVSNYLDITGGTIANSNPGEKAVYCYLITAPVLKNVEAKPISIEANKYGSI